MVYDVVYALEKTCVWLAPFVDNKSAFGKSPCSAHLMLWICSGFSTAGFLLKMFGRHCWQPFCFQVWG